MLGEEILARQRGEALCGLRLLLHGGAGVGKTDFSLTLATLLDVPAEVISLSSSQAAAYLAGSEQYWSNTQPGIVWRQLIQGNHANPIFVLDETDKVRGGPEKSGSWISDISASMGDESCQQPGADSNEKTET